MTSTNAEKRARQQMGVMAGARMKVFVGMLEVIEGVKFLSHGRILT
jgi:hypothetical protein